MKVKNIVFSGFAAAILAGVSGAHAADPVTPYNLATTEYVTKQTGLKQDKLSADNAAAPITISVDESGKATIGADLEETLAPYAKTADVETTLASYATKDDLDGALDEGGALTEAVDTAVNSAIQEAVTSGEIGNAITDAVKNKADTSYVDGQLAKKQGLRDLAAGKKLLDEGVAVQDDRQVDGLCKRGLENRDVPPASPPFVDIDPGEKPASLEKSAL